MSGAEERQAAEQAPTGPADPVEEPVDETGAAEAADVAEEPAPLVIRRRGRRVTTEPSPGWIGEPEQERTQSRENDDRLRGDVPPHWG